jgi:cytochrome c biogenesis protein CcdA
MVQLLTVLTPIGLLDSTSIVPLCIVILVVLLAGPNPVARSGALILGVFTVYLACGLLILLGLQSAFDQINAYMVRLWNAPETEELILQVLLGVVLCVLALQMSRNRKKKAADTKAAPMTAMQALIAGAGLTIVSLPGAVPYFAAIDLTLRADLTLAQRVLAICYYNLVFVAPLIVIVGLSRALGERGERMLAALKAFFDTWGQRVIAALLTTLGIVLLVDGVGWFLGYPLIPI